MILDIIIQYPLTSARRLSVFLKHIHRTAREEKCKSYDDSSAYCLLITSLSFILLVSHLGKVSSTSAPAPFTNWSNATNLSTKSTTVNLRTSSGTTGINYQNATTERERSSSNNDKLWLIILAVVLVVLATIFGIVLFLRCRRQKLYRPSRVDAGENRKESCSIQMHNDTVVTLPER